MKAAAKFEHDLVSEGPSKDRRRASRAIRWLRLSIVASLLIPLSIFAFAAWHTRGAALADAQADALRSVATVAEHALKVIETNGLVLDMVDEATRGLSCAELRASTDIPASMARMIRHAPQIETVFVLDERGTICTASQADRIDNNSRADRDYFGGAREAPLDQKTGEPTFYIGRGLIGRIGNVPFFSMARRRSALDADEREFKGVVLAAIELKYMISYWRGIAVPNMRQRIALFRADGALLARSAEPQVQQPNPALESRTATTWAGAPEGVVIGPSPLDGVERVRAWKALPRWELVALTSFDKDVVLQPWREAILVYGFTAVLASLALVSVSASAMWWVRREEAAARQGRAELARRLEAESQLRQAQKMEALGQLTGGVAHDFNNLLMAMTGSLELLRKRLSVMGGNADDPRIVRLLDNAQQAAQRGAVLTQRMLAFARRQDLQPQAVDVPELVRGMSELLRRSLGPLVDVETRFSINLPPAHVDPHQLEMALLNLAVNARDAMAGGSRDGKITISAHEETIGLNHSAGLKLGSFVCVSVTDTGEGMDEATLARVTEPFFTTKGVGKGTGLGLSMVHGLAEQSGGRLILKSRKGEGTTAELWLPRAEVAELVSVPATEVVETPSQAIGRPTVHTVLLVDDDPLVLSGTSGMLEDLGHAVIEASSGQEALEMVRTGARIDLIISDYAMPGMDGLQLATEVRVIRPSLQVILMTGYAELPDDAELDLPRLAKPFTQTALAKALVELRARSRDRSNVVSLKQR